MTTRLRVVLDGTAETSGACNCEIFALVRAHDGGTVDLVALNDSDSEAKLKKLMPAPGAGLTQMALKLVF